MVRERNRVPVPVALQLHTIQGAVAQDASAALDRVARIGYLGVETSALHGLRPDEFRRSVDDSGLEVVGAFSSMQPAAGWEQFLDEQEALANDVVVTCFMPEHFESRDAVARAAERFNEVAELLHGRAMTLYYHNHAWEFMASEAGPIPMNVLLEHLEQDIVLEPDFYWIKAAGHDPVAMLSQLRPRVARLHVKDGPGTVPPWPKGMDDLDPQTAVGHGTLDIVAALRAAPQVAWHVVELDKYAGDPFDAVEASYDYLTSTGLSKGRES
jgi:sugar phosphate isomerase/epimerase